MSAGITDFTDTLSPVTDALLPMLALASTTAMFSPTAAATPVSDCRSAAVESAMALPVTWVSTCTVTAPLLLICTPLPMAASVVALFEGTIQQATALAVFMPIVAGMGGNAATQTLTVIVRGLALGELSWNNARKTLFKEALIGLGNGLALGLVAAGVAWVTKSDPMLGLLLGMAMVCNMFVAATAGTLVPLGLKALKVDPALGSSVFITTATDVVGFASFLGLATIFLSYLAR